MCSYEGDWALVKRRSFVDCMVLGIHGLICNDKGEILLFPDVDSGRSNLFDKSFLVEASARGLHLIFLKSFLFFNVGSVCRCRRVKVRRLFKMRRVIFEVGLHGELILKCFSAFLLSIWFVCAL